LWAGNSLTAKTEWFKEFKKKFDFQRNFLEKNCVHRNLVYTEARRKQSTPNNFGLKFFHFNLEQTVTTVAHPMFATIDENGNNTFLLT